MQQSFIQPHPALKPFVEGYFYVELDSQLPSTPWDIHPLGRHTMGIVFDEDTAILGDGQHVGGSLSYHGYLCRHVQLTPLAPRTRMLIVAFTHTGAARLFRLPQHELTNQIIPITEVMPHTEQLTVQLVEKSACWHTVVQLIDNWLLKNIPSEPHNYYAPHIARACQLICYSQGSMRIRRLSQEVGMSQRHLENHFKNLIGVSPKLYSRIARFTAAYQFIHKQSQVDWSEVVYHYQFFDQAHFIRDFKSFFGYAPSNIHLANNQLARNLMVGN